MASAVQNISERKEHDRPHSRNAEQSFPVSRDVTASRGAAAAALSQMQTPGVQTGQGLLSAASVRDQLLAQKIQLESKIAAVE